MKFYDINGNEKGNLATEEWITYTLQNPDTTRFSNYKGFISINKSLGLCSITIVLTFAQNVMVDNERIAILSPEIYKQLKNGVLFNCGYVVSNETDFVKLEINNANIVSYVAGANKHFNALQVTKLFYIDSATY